MAWASSDRNRTGSGLEEFGEEVIPKAFRLDEFASGVRLLAHRVFADLCPSGRVCRR